MRLITHPPDPSERIPLMVATFSERNEIEAAKLSCGGDAQALVGALDQVLYPLLSLRNLPSNLRFRFLPCRKGVRCASTAAPEEAPEGVAQDT